LGSSSWQPLDARTVVSDVLRVSERPIPVQLATPAAVCRVCAAAVRLDVSSADALSAHVRRFMDAHHHDGGSDIVIDITDVSDERQAG
jgi:hypothetical protein